MIMFRNKKSLVVPIIVGILEFAWLYLYAHLFFRYDMLISQDNVTWNNICIKLIGDYLSILLLPTIIILINRKHLSDFQLCLKSRYEIIALFGVMIILFLLHNDYTISGLYPFFFYLIVVAFGEELIYRGFLYNRIKIKSKVIAILLSGILWGIPHAIIPSVVSNADINQFIITMCSQIGFGIVIVGISFIF